MQFYPMDLAAEQKLRGTLTQIVLKFSENSGSNKTRGNALDKTHERSLL